jgi:L-asparaginase II
MVELWRGPFLESVHSGHAVICDETGQIVQAWGDPDQVILPRSSSKIIQALPLIESGAADAFGLRVDQLALSCASHQGAAIHSDRVQAWLGDLGLSDGDLRCGLEVPRDHPARDALIKTDGSPCQYHNNCSGKHSGFLTLTKHLGAGADYIELDHPVQRAVKEAHESVTGTDSPGFGIDGCSAPNFATTVHGLARAMAQFASADDTTSRGRAMTRLVDAMVTFPELVAGETRACTELMRAMGKRAAIKTGAEGVFIAIVPEQKLGVALKISDGTTRAAECVMAAILVKLGVLEANHPATLKRLNAPILNRRNVDTGIMRVVSGLF